MMCGGAEGTNRSFDRGIACAAGTLARTRRRQNTLLLCAPLAVQLYPRVVGARGPAVARAGGNGHTQPPENKDEIEMVEQETGHRTSSTCRNAGLQRPHIVLAHCVSSERQRDGSPDSNRNSCLALSHRQTQTRVGLCADSGDARAGISVSLGADGAPCNNRLDMFSEMRTARSFKRRYTARRFCRRSRSCGMATIDGAPRVGRREIGSMKSASALI